ncbi:MAG: SRPBCC domain-containing protein [Saprospiraceae bacterium]|nr:SRPBCC domain-containing protein [Saprospiraceae bacterium]
MVKQFAEVRPQILIRRIYPHPVPAVWRAIATGKGLSAWLMPTLGFRPVIGTAFTFTTQRYGRFDGTVHCRVVDIEVNRLISYTWSSNVLPETVVSFEIKEISPNQTLLILSHHGFSGFKGWFTKVILRLGWRNLLRKKLAKYLKI